MLFGYFVPSDLDNDYCRVVDIEGTAEDIRNLVGSQNIGAKYRYVNKTKYVLFYNLDVQTDYDAPVRASAKDSHEMLRGNILALGAPDDEWYTTIYPDNFFDFDWQIAQSRNCFLMYSIKPPVLEDDDQTPPDA